MPATQLSPSRVLRLRILARQASASDDGLSVSPLVNTDRKGGAFSIMLQQFRRAIGVAIVSWHAKHKLRRLHYVIATAAEAEHVCNANHSENRWRPSQNGRSSWYSAHIPEGYATFEQFVNGYDFRVPWGVWIFCSCGCCNWIVSIGSRHSYISSYLRTIKCLSSS